MAAQRLRYRVFAAERGVALQTPIPGLESDAFDPYCDHIVVHDDRAGAIVGTYRILPPDRASELGRYYSESEFDLGPLAPLRAGLGELGRSCVAPEYRTGAVLQLLWGGIARYVVERGVQFVMGCASIDARDGGGQAQAMYEKLKSEHGCVADFGVLPRIAVPRVLTSQPEAVTIPPLIKAYLRAGAVLCGPPSLDPVFQTADLLLLLDVADLAPRYARHFFDNQDTRPAELEGIDAALV